MNLILKNGRKIIIQSFDTFYDDENNGKKYYVISVLDKLSEAELTDIFSNKNNISLMSIETSYSKEILKYSASSLEKIKIYKDKLVFLNT